MGDIVSVIDMPPKVLSTWWRGKHGFQVSNQNTGCEKVQSTLSVFHSCSCLQDVPGYVIRDVVQRWVMMC